LTVTGNGVVRLWDLTPRETPLPPWLHKATQIAGSLPPGDRLVTVAPGPVVEVWDTKTWKLMWPPIPETNSLYTALPSPDGRELLLGSKIALDESRVEFRLNVWETLSARLVRSFSVPGHKPDRLWPNWHSTQLAFIRSNSVELFDYTTGHWLTAPLRHPEEVSLVRFSPDSKDVACLSGRNVFVWIVATAQPKFAPLAHPTRVVELNFSADGRHLITACAERNLAAGTATIWDARTGRAIRPPMAHDKGVLDANFSPDGQRVITCSDDGTARVWDVNTSQPLSPPLKHRDSVLKAFFSPDGRKVVTASFDRTARVWDGVTGEPLSPPLNHAKPVDFAMFLGNGDWLLTHCDRESRFWESSPDPRPLEDLLALANLVTGQKLDATGAPAHVERPTLSNLWHACGRSAGRVSPVAADIPARRTSIATRAPALAKFAGAGFQNNSLPFSVFSFFKREDRD
jgi:WD40 repeat protein